MKNIAVIGAGTMGNGIAHVFAQNGFTVSLIDVSDAALEKAAHFLDRGDLLLSAHREEKGKREKKVSFMACHRDDASAVV